MNSIERAFKIYCDNNSVVLYSNINMSSLKLKHIHIKFLIIKEIVQSRQVFIEYIWTNSMIANPLTKDLMFEVFYEHAAHMGVMLFDDVLV